MSTDNTNDHNAAKSQEEDYNLNEEAEPIVAPDNRPKGDYQQRRNQPSQRYQQQDAQFSGPSKGGNMFQKSRNQQSTQYENNFNNREPTEEEMNSENIDDVQFAQNVDLKTFWDTPEDVRHNQDADLGMMGLPSYAEYQASKRGQIQQELYQLIKEKVATSNDPEKAKTFVRKLKELAETKNLLIDNITIMKVEEFLLRKKEINDEEIYYQRLNDLSGESERNAIFNIDKQEQFRPLIDTDTYKDPLIKDDDDLHQFISKKAVAQINENRLQLDQYDLSEYNETSILSTYPDDQLPFEYDEYEEKRQIQMMNQDTVQDQFSQLSRVSDLHTDWKSEYEMIKSKEEARRGEGYMDTRMKQAPTELELKQKFEQQNESIEDEQSFANTVADLDQDLINAFEYDLKTQYDLLKNLMKLNVIQKERLRQNIESARLYLQECIKKRNQLFQKLEASAHEHVSDAIPDRLGGFIKNEKRIQAEQMRNKRKSNAELSHNQNFKLSSIVPEEFENELQVLVNLYKSEKTMTTQDQKEYLAAFNTLVQAITKNKIEMTQGLQARLFEYAVIAKNQDLANRNLSSLNKVEFIEKHNVIDQDLLQQFFVQSLRRDNFDGLGHLIHYMEKFELWSSSFPLRNFHNALNFYINTQFKLSNVLIFTRFYSHFIHSKLDKAIKFSLPIDSQNKQVSDLANHEKLKIAKEVFSNPDAQVASIRELFSVLVKKLGSQEAVDPLTREDSLWKFIDSQTKRGILELAQLSGQPNSIIDEKDLASYFKNHLHSSKAFERLTQVVLRLNNQAQSEHFINLMVQHLKEYQSQDGNMPFSFQPNKLRNAYSRLKLLKKEQGSNLILSDKTLEYFLFLFRQQKMFVEVIDLCENFNLFTGASSDSNSEIKSYYLSDALLQLPSKQHYTSILQDAVYNGKLNKNDPSQLTQMTKAMFLDGSAQNAVKYFVNGVESMRELKEKREDVLVKLFDASYIEQNGNPENLTYDQFKLRYLNLIQYSEKILKESYAVSTLTRAISQKNYDEIEALFQIYLLEKEENQILSSLHYYEAGIDEQLKNTNPDQLRGLDSKTINRLHLLRERKAALKSGVSQNDIEAILSLRSVVNDDKVTLFEGLETKSADQLQKIFKIMSKDQIEDVLYRTQPLYKAASSMIKDENTSILNQFEETIKNNLKEAIQQTEEEASEFRDIPNQKIEETNQKYFSGLQLNEEQEERYMHEISDLYDYQYRLPIREDTDPEVLAERVFNRNLNDMKGDLLNAINNRKGKVLSIAIEIFNKLQDQNVNVQKLGDITQKPWLVKEDIEEALQKYNVLLNDQRSPIWSALSSMAQVSDNDLPPFEYLFTSGDDMDEKRLPIELARRESQMISQANEQLAQSMGRMKHIQNLLISQIKDLSTGKTQYEQTNAKVIYERDNELKKQLEIRMQGLYSEYKNTKQKADESKKRDGQFSRQEKLSIMRDIFNVEFQDTFTKDVFPAFYSQELIIFGMTHDIPEAVRIGEHMMSQNGQTLPVEIQKAVKEYTLINSEKYQKAVKNTGLIDNSRLYHAGKKNQDPTIINWDDPYWQDMVDKNRRRVDHYKMPSIHAWDHKKYGILGEVIDMKKIEKITSHFQTHSRLF